MTETGNEPALAISVDRPALMNAAAEHVVAKAARAIADHGRFTWVLAGGATPRELYALLASAAFRGRVDWSRADFFWGDERCVPPEHGQSNYRMVRETLLDVVRPEPRQVHRMRGEQVPETAAIEYADELARVFSEGRFRPAGSPPSFDLVLLGMGEDGHTASLFPGSAALNEDRRWVVPAQPAPGGPWRLTLTLPVLNAASAVCFLVAGAAKRDRLAEVWRAPAAAAASLPAARVRPHAGELRWLVDAEAAGRLVP
jgi:6-phosphogluconolactonase